MTVRSKTARPEPQPARPPSARILGVDPGSIVTGWGLIGGRPADPEWLDAGVIRLGPSDTPLSDRLLRLHQELETLVRRLGPTCAAVESPYQGSNARSALQLAHARGVVLVVLAGAGLEVAEYTPATVKKAVTGNGRAPKEQVRSMVGRLLDRPGLVAPDDLADALAVALCHGSSRRYHALASPSRSGRVEAPETR
jgi:crossover junction endodeoxyribonuclease RuvC